MRNSRVAFAGFLFAAAVSCLGADAVILRGGSRIDLREPPKQQGNTAILTRPDGTLLSIPMTEIDWKATAALRDQKPAAARPAIFAPPSSPADALRTGHEEKARVRLTDADVGHAAELPARPGEKIKPADMKANAPRVEVGEYTQQKSGTNLLVSGQVMNPGTTSALNVRLMVSAVDEEGRSVGTSPATLANGTVEGGQSVAFSASLPVGDTVVTQVRFTPQWQSPPPPAPPAAAGAAAAAPAAGNGAAGTAAPAAAAAPASRPPGPAPTPYGQGSLYAAPAPSAPSTAPADGHTGYIPGASTPDNQPKPPQ